MKNLSLPFFALAMFLVFGGAIASAQKSKLKNASPAKPAPNKTAVAESKPTAKTGGDVKQAPTVSTLEAEVLAELNLLRQNPAAYVEFLEAKRKFYDGLFLRVPNHPAVLTKEGVKPLDEAIEFLKLKRPPLAALKPMRGLASAADLHLRDMLAQSFSGHRGSDGSFPDERVSRYGAAGGEVKEIISYFAPTARQIVLNYLIDDGVPRRSHRQALLKNNLNTVGIVTGTSDKFHRVCVVVMVESFIEK